MKKHIYMVSTALVIGMAAPVAAQDDFAGFSEGILAMLGSQGADISYDARNVGADGSVEFIGFSMISPDGMSSVQADWIKGVPSASTPGQVTFTLSPSASFSFTDSETGEHIINISNSGLVATLDGITSGQDAEVLNFSVVANSLGFTSGNPNDTVLKALDVTFSDLNQTVAFSPASKLLRAEFGVSLLNLIYDLTPPDGTQMASNGQVVDLQAAVQIIADDNERNFIDYLSGATTAFIEMSAGISTATAKMLSPEARIAYSASSASTNIELRAENGRLDYALEGGRAEYSFTEININGTPIPPFDMAIDEAAMKLSMPTVSDGTFEEANAVIAMRGVQLSESLYEMFDPGQQISRDPINAVVDISANVMPKIDWNNPDAAFGSGNPDDIAEVQDITINEVLFTAGGAEITAEGGAVIDNSMGFPFPTGKVTITAAGIQALANGLVAIGLIPQDQAGMMMGAMMAFARPGEVADEFISDIEFSPQGITANGVPLPM